MILGRDKILAALASGAIVCEPAPDAVEATHIDLHLGRWYYRPRSRIARVDAASTDPHACYDLCDAERTSGVIVPGYALVLAHTVEIAGTTVPALLPTIETRSTLARWGLAAHISAGYGDPGYCSRWTLELYNHHAWPIALPIGARIACITFHEVDGNDVLYAARYNTRGAWQPSDMLPRRRNV